MIARRESSVALRIASGVASAGTFDSAAPDSFVRASMALPSLASTAGHRPSSADSQSGRASGAGLGVHAGLADAFFTSSAFSRRLPKNAAHEGSTEFGSLAHLA